MEGLTITYFVYMFVSIYFLAFLLILYVRNRENLFGHPTAKREYSVSVLIPCYNEEESIEDTLDSVMKMEYSGIKEVIAINDGSKDQTIHVLNLLKKKYPLLKILDKKNSGKADSLNQAIKIAKGELIVIVDSDSFPREDALEKTVGFFDDPQVGVATIPILVRNKKTLLGRMQALEYATIALTRKLLEPINAIYVTPGPFAVYRKKALLDVGGFDSENMTEDVELTWHLASRNWKRMMTLDTEVTTIAPEKLKTWWRQRNRWDVGGLQCIGKYAKQMVKNPRNIVSYFIVPFFSLSISLGLIGMGIFIYLFSKGLMSKFFFTQYALIANTSVIDFGFFTPSILTYFGLVLFVISFLFSWLTLYLMETDLFSGKKFWEFVFYLVVYLMLYPFVLITATFKFIKRDMTW
jgi:biofilm PGA synthesis N-glycosyltransferase PgaC